MTKTDLATFRELLRAKQIELSGKSLSLERIAIERSADELEEAEYKSLREMAIAGLNRESAMRRSIELALRRITDRSFGVCVHFGEEVKRRRLEAVPWTPFCIRCQEAADRGDEGVLESIQSTFSRCGVILSL
jgi:RNA polymerase-binding transcription factor